MESENKEERGETGKGCRKRELIHQPKGTKLPGGDAWGEIQKGGEEAERTTISGSTTWTTCIYSCWPHYPSEGKGEITGMCMNSMNMA